MLPLARRNLLHDKIRLAVTLTGVVFAVVLIAVELGLFFGFTQTTSSLIDHSGADLWVTARHVPYLELGVSLNERKLYQVKAVPGIADAEKFINRGTRWNRLDDGQEQIYVVGFNPDAGMGGPWNVVQGSVADLRTPDGVIVDEFYKKKLGVTSIGEVFEINRHRARVVGFTNGIRSFTTQPYVFTNVQHAQDFAALREDETTYLLVRTEPGAKPASAMATRTRSEMRLHGPTMNMQAVEARPQVSAMRASQNLAPTRSRIRFDGISQRK